jgi:hypothetical protein
VAVSGPQQCCARVVCSLCNRIFANKESLLEHRSVLNHVDRCQQTKAPQAHESPHQAAPAGGPKIRSVTPHLQTMCRFNFKPGGCKRGASCRFSHAQLPISPVIEEASASSPRPAPTADTRALCEWHIKDNCKQFFDSHISCLISFAFNFLGRYGRWCKDLHGLKCATCKLNVLHPFNKQQRLAHNCQALDQECSICGDGIIVSDKKFAVLDCCNHVFCSSCISTNRKTSGQPNAKNCPMCRMKCSFVAKSTLFPSTPQQKDKTIQDMTLALGKIPCKYFVASGPRKLCYFGNHCRYAHLNYDGSRSAASHFRRRKKRRPQHGSDDELIIDVLETVPDFDMFRQFLAQNPEQDLDLLMGIMASLEDVAPAGAAVAAAANHSAT